MPQLTEAEKRLIEQQAQNDWGPVDQPQAKPSAWAGLVQPSPTPAKPMTYEEYKTPGITTSGQILRNNDVVPKPSAWASPTPTPKVDPYLNTAEIISHKRGNPSPTPKPKNRP